jgi:hypothetical protein
VSYSHKIVLHIPTNYFQFPSDKAYQLFVHGRWFSLDNPASSTTKAGHHDIAEILLKVPLNTKNQSIKINHINHSPHKYRDQAIHVDE